MRTELNILQCLKSINNINWLIIDSLSTDKSSERIEYIKNNYSNMPIEIIREKDNGIYNAMNKAILRVNSKFIIFVNSGDSLEYSLLKQINLQDINKFYSIICSYRNLSINKFPLNLLKIILHNFESYFHFSLPSSHNAIIYSSFILKQNLFDEKYICAADYNQYLQMLNSKSRFIYKKKYKLTTITSNGFVSKRKFISYCEYIKINKENNFLFSYLYWKIRLKLFNSKIFS